MKPKLYMAPVVLPFALFVVLCLSFSPTPSYSQGLSSWISSGTWWDWSDYRFTMEYRYFVPQLVSGNLNRDGKEYDLLASPSPPNSREGGYNFDHQPPPFNSGIFQFQVDRLGLRLRVDEDMIFRGFMGSKGYVSGITGQDDYFRVSELDLSSTRVGICLDLVRYPFLRGGIDFDLNINSVTFYDAKAAILPQSKTVNGITTWDLTGDRLFKTDTGPATVGLHLFAVPARVREVPIIVQAKINFPVPYWKQITGIQYEARMLDWEVMAGARPSVWDASAFGFSTFSLGVEAGFRSVTLDAEFTNSTSIRAQWQGPFFQLGLYY